MANLVVLQPINIWLDESSVRPERTLAEAAEYCGRSMWVYCYDGTVDDAVRRWNLGCAVIDLVGRVRRTRQSALFRRQEKISWEYQSLRISNVKTAPGGSCAGGVKTARTDFVDDPPSAQNHSFDRNRLRRALR